MARRPNWDKLRRQSKASPAYDPIDSFKPRPARRRYHRRPRRQAQANPQPQAAPHLPTVARCAVIRSRKTGELVGTATWWKLAGQWKLVGALPRVSWLLETPLANVAQELNNRGLCHTWKAEPLPDFSAVQK